MIDNIIYILYDNKIDKSLEKWLCTETKVKVNFSYLFGAFEKAHLQQYFVEIFSNIITLQTVKVQIIPVQLTVVIVQRFLSSDWLSYVHYLY